MRLPVLVLLMLISSLSFGQTNSFGMWETNSWKKLLRKTDDGLGNIEKNYSDGTLKYEAMFRDGLPIGTWKSYDVNGRVWRESNWNGAFVEYDYYGRLRVKGEYKDGQPIGVWNYYVSNCDSAYVYTSYNVDSDSLIEYVYRYVQGEGSPCYDRRVLDKKTVTYIPDYFEANQGGGYFTFHGGTGQESANINALNESFNSVFGQQFDSRLFNTIGMSLGSAEGLRLDIDVNWRGTDSLRTDTLKYGLSMGGATFNLNYDLIPHKAIDISPYAGIGYYGTTLSYSQHNNATDTVSVNGLFNQIQPSNQGFGAYQRINYRSSNFIVDAGLNVRWNLPLGPFYTAGFFVGGKVGYMQGVGPSKWKYNLIGVTNSSQEVDFIPTVPISGFHWQGMVGYYVKF